MPKSPQETEEETSDKEEDRYYRAERKKKAVSRHVSRGDSDKENRPPDTSATEVCANKLNDLLMDVDLRLYPVAHYTIQYQKVGVGAAFHNCRFPCTL